jgi:hypothetical protein
MIINGNFYGYWEQKGHKFGVCMTRKDIDVMYVNIPKNATSWTKPNLMDFGWEFYNYHDEGLNKHALVVLRDPVDRWISGIAEYFTLYYSDAIESTWSKSMFDIIFDRVAFDDHTEKQIQFLHGLDTVRCTFMWFDETYRSNFSHFMKDLTGLPNRYHRYDYQHVSENDPVRKKFKEIFRNEMATNPKRLDSIKQYYAEDYKLIDLVTFYEPRQPNC